MVSSAGKACGHKKIGHGGHEYLTSALSVVALG